MTDKELLELAAKAAGIINQGYCESGFLFTGTGESGAFYKWNPLTNDGDALRLAVKLGISVYVEDENHGGFTMAEVHIGDEYEGNSVMHNDDPYNATRRAIVHAAAEIARQAGEIGKEMK